MGGCEITDEEALEALVTVRDWLRYAASRFGEAGLVFGHGTDCALDEAAFLILHTLNLPVDRLDPWLDARLTGQERRRLLDIIERRISTRKPAPYLTGVAYIQGHRFRVDERVIVPRSYIGELLCTGGLAAALPVSQSIRHILDLCTGSGCLAILGALAFPEAQVDATELSAEALEVAAGNVADYALQQRIALHQGDLFAPVAGRTYDLILANPPYVAGAEAAAFPPEYAHEPALAHRGGADGLDIVRRIIREAARHLNDGGVLVVEVGTGRAVLEGEYRDLPFLWLDTEASEGEVFAIGAADLARSSSHSDCTQSESRSSHSPEADANLKPDRSTCRLCSGEDRCVE
jgi:ribosomal protein L3 glutamine methyltransferase